MYRHILVALDGSDFGERALPMAVTLAKASGAQVTLVRAAWTTVAPGTDAIEAQRKVVADAETYLAGVASRLLAEGINAEAAVPYAAAAEGILAEITVRHADMVVMCTHGRSGLGRWVYGSAAAAVLAKSSVPVLLVRPIGPLARLLAASATPAVLLPVDGSAFSEAALPHAVMLVRALAGALVLLRVVVPPLGYYPDPVLGQPYVSDVGERLIDDAEQEAEQYVTDLAGRLAAEGLAVQHAVRVGFPSETILDEAKTAGAQLIVMATHGRTGLGEMLLGSVALDVLRRGVLPLLLVRPPDLGSSASIASGSEQW